MTWRTSPGCGNRCLIYLIKDCITRSKRDITTDSHIVSLIKPQFEAGREKVGKNGVVRSPDIHKEVLSEVLSTCLQLGLTFKGLTFSPIKGPKGNIEFLIHLYKGKGNTVSPYKNDIEYGHLIDDTVKAAHSEL